MMRRLSLALASAGVLLVMASAPTLAHDATTVAIGFGNCADAHPGVQTDGAPVSVTVTYADLSGQLVTSIYLNLDPPIVYAETPTGSGTVIYDVSAPGGTVVKVIVTTPDGDAEPVVASAVVPRCVTPAASPAPTLPATDAAAPTGTDPLPMGAVVLMACGVLTLWRRRLSA